MAEKKIKDEGKKTENSIKDAGTDIVAKVKKAGHDIKQAGADLKEDATNAGHDIMGGTGHIREDAGMVGHEMKEELKDDIQKTYSKVKRKMKD
jgi:gas vesicle protein